jgi:prolyl oligopeptidase
VDRGWKRILLRALSRAAAGKSLEAALSDKKIYYHALGTQQSADRLIYARPDERGLFIDAELDETGRYLWIETNKGTSNKNELFVKDLGDPLKPNFDAPIRALYPNHTAEYIPLGVVSGTLYLKTDLGAPNKKIVAVAIDKPDAGNWTTVVPDRQGRDRVGGDGSGQNRRQSPGGCGERRVVLQP